MYVPLDAGCFLFGFMKCKSSEKQKFKFFFNHLPWSAKLQTKTNYSNTESQGHAPLVFGCPCSVRKFLRMHRKKTPKNTEHNIRDIDKLCLF